MDLKESELAKPELGSISREELRLPVFAKIAIEKLNKSIVQKQVDSLTPHLKLMFLTETSVESLPSKETIMQRSLIFIKSRNTIIKKSEEFHTIYS